MKPEIVQTQSWRYKTIVVIKRQQQTTIWWPYKKNHTAAGKPDWLFWRKKIHEIVFFGGRLVGVKKLFDLLAFSLQQAYLFFGGSWHILSDWYLGLLNI